MKRRRMKSSRLSCGIAHTVSRGDCCIRCIAGALVPGHRASPLRDEQQFEPWVKLLSDVSKPEPRGGAWSHCWPRGLTAAAHPDGVANGVATEQDSAL